MENRVILMKPGESEMDEKITLFGKGEKAAELQLRLASKSN